MTNMERFLIIVSTLSPILVELFVQAGIKAEIKANEKTFQSKSKRSSRKKRNFWMKKLELREKIGGGILS